VTSDIAPTSANTCKENINKMPLKPSIISSPENNRKIKYSLSTSTLPDQPSHFTIKNWNE